MKSKILIALAFISTNVFSQNWNLQQCIDYALKNNLTLKQNEINVEMNQVSYQQSKATILPSLNAGANNTWNNGQMGRASCRERV